MIERPAQVPAYDSHPSTWEGFHGVIAVAGEDDGPAYWSYSVSLAEFAAISQIITMYAHLQEIDREALRIFVDRTVEGEADEMDLSVEILLERTCLGTWRVDRRGDIRELFPPGRPRTGLTPAAIAERIENKLDKLLDDIG
jgi:hypothetical protein